jgi:hypothetical protein
MPQFDTFSFFSQLFWVLIGFSYLYLLLSFYILPAFAAILKIRAKKLAQINTAANATEIVASRLDNSAFFENITVKLNNLTWTRGNLVSDINFSYNHLGLKNEAFYKLNFLVLNEFKIVSFFI